MLCMCKVCKSLCGHAIVDKVMVLWSRWPQRRTFNFNRYLSIGSKWNLKQNVLFNFDLIFFSVCSCSCFALIDKSKFFSPSRLFQFKIQIYFIKLISNMKKGVRFVFIYLLFVYDVWNENLARQIYFNK